MNNFVNKYEKNTKLSYPFISPSFFASFKTSQN